MDPFSSEGELVNIHTAFIQGQYDLVLSSYTPTDFSPANHLPVQILQYRAQCALGQAASVLASLSPVSDQTTPDLAAVHLYAQTLSSSDPTPTPELLSATQELASAHGAGNLTVQLLCATILARSPELQHQDAALALLNNSTSLDSLALTIQIQLLQNRPDLATNTARSARSFAGDAPLVNLAEAWIGLRKGGEEYQKAFYVFEELAQAPSSKAARTLVSQAVAEVHLGRVEEAEVALKEAGEMGEDEVYWANRWVLDLLAGRDAEEARGKSVFLAKDVEEKRGAFRQAMGKYSPKFEA